MLQQIEAESYIGVTLWSHDGRPIGLIAVIESRPLTNQAQAESLLRLVAVRAAAELERKQAGQSLCQRPGRHCRCRQGNHPANVIAHHGVNFIQKPFSKRDLIVKVQEALERD